MRGALGGNVEVAVPLRLVSSTGGRRVSLRMTPHRSPPPWMVEEHNDACFIVRDATGQALGYFYFEDEPARRFNNKNPALTPGFWICWQYFNLLL